MFLFEKNMFQLGFSKIVFHVYSIYLNQVNTNGLSQVTEHNWVESKHDFKTWF